MKAKGPLLGTLPSPSLHPPARFFPAVACPLKLADSIGALTFAEEAVYFVCLHKLLDSHVSFVLHLRREM